MPTKVYQHDEAAIFWSDTGSSPTELFTLTSKGDGTGRQGAMHDFTASARPQRWAWRAYTQVDATTPVLGKLIRVYFKTGSGATATTRPDNDDGSGDIDVSAEDKLKNLKHLGNIIVDEAVANKEFVASGEMDVPHRWGAPVFWNASGAGHTATAAEHGFEMVPIPLESQEA